MSTLEEGREGGRERREGGREGGREGKVQSSLHDSQVISCNSYIPFIIILPVFEGHSCILNNLRHAIFEARIEYPILQEAGRGRVVHVCRRK